MSEIHPSVTGHWHFGSRDYRRSYRATIMIIDGIMTITGLLVLGLVFTWAKTPGDYEVTLHVTFGALIATLSFFRASMGYGAAWPEFVLFVLGLFVFLLPTWIHMLWDGKYTTAHWTAGGIVMVLSVISAIITTLEVRRMRKA